MNNPIYNDSHMKNTDFEETQQGINSSDYKINSGVMNVTNPTTFSPISNARFDTTPSQLNQYFRNS